MKFNISRKKISRPMRWEWQPYFVWYPMIIDGHIVLFEWVWRRKRVMLSINWCEEYWQYSLKDSHDA